MKVLEKYVEDQNKWNKIFNDPAIDVPTTPDECKPLFSKLAGELSPENLSCDGELSRTKINARYRTLMAVWKQLEKVFGHTVDESEVWEW